MWARQTPLRKRPSAKVSRAMPPSMTGMRSAYAVRFSTARGQGRSCPQFSTRHRQSSAAATPAASARRQQPGAYRWVPRTSAAGARRSASSGASGSDGCAVTPQLSARPCCCQPFGTNSRVGVPARLTARPHRSTFGVLRLRNQDQTSDAVGRPLCGDVFTLRYKGSRQPTTCDLSRVRCGWCWTVAGRSGARGEATHPGRPRLRGGRSSWW